MATAVLAASLAAPAIAPGGAQPARSNDDFERGRDVHDTRCLGCHGHEVYLPARRHAKTLSQLEAEVRRWNGALSPPLTKAELALVTRYLNAGHYRF